MKFNLKIILALIAIVIAIIFIVSISAYLSRHNGDWLDKGTYKSVDQVQVSDPKANSKNNLIAGSDSRYYSFSMSEYEAAIADGKIVFLDFYANWCPICRAEAPEIETGFDELSRNDVVGFRVNFKDDATSDDEKKLAQEFSIPYQHTKVILKNGRELKRFGDQWDKQTFLKELGDI